MMLLDLLKMEKIIVKNSKGEIVEINSFTFSSATLNCHSQGITEILSILNDTIDLYCFNNELTSLPKLPKTLKFLHCYRNKLTNLPELPQNLQHLICEHNNIKQLPDLRKIKKLTNVHCDICCFEDYMLEMKDIDFKFYC